MLLGVRSVGSHRRRLSSTHHLTRGTRLGRSFLTGVDRRVHAPLGTVINFTGVLTVSSRLRRSSGVRCVSAVGQGDRLLLGLVGSVLRLSHVRSKGVAFRVDGYRISRLIGGICAARGMLVPTRLSFVRRISSVPVRVRMSRSHLARILAGFLGGTSGFAGRKCVGLNCYCMPRRDRMHVCIRSANVNVPVRRRHVVFDHFCGRSRFTRKAKLKLSVYRLVIRGSNKDVRL